MRYYILFILLLSIYIIYSLQFDTRNQKKPFLSYYRFNEHRLKKSPSIDIIEPFNTLFAKYRIHKVDHFTQADILFFKLLTDYIHLFPTIVDVRTPLYIYGIRSIDILASKAHLHTILSVNESKHRQFTPVTYLLSNDDEYQLFLKSFQPSKLYILKKNIQRQKGCTITNNIEYIKQSKYNHYVVGQELLLDPFLINGHKINLRQYLLIIIKKKCKFLLYNNGFMYYTPKPFKKNSTDIDRHITTGYIDRSIYERNPLTVQEFYQYLGDRKAAVLKSNLIKLFKYIDECYTPSLLKYDSNHHLNFMIMGCDVAVNNNLECKIMEINKGPDLTYKDERDKFVKYNMIQDTLHEIGLINKPNKNFIQLH